MTSDPIRLLDNPATAAGLRADLAHAGGAAVTGLDKSAGLVGLKAAITAEGATAAASTTAASGLLGKVLLGAAIVGGGAVAVWSLGQPEPTPPAAVEPVAHAVPAALADTEPSPAPARSQAIPTPPPVEPAAVDAEDDVESSVPEEVAPPKSRVHQGAKRHKKLDASPTLTPEAAVLREARMVADAREALGGNANRALALTREAARQFPKGQLAQEREAIAIRALAKLGRRDAAQARAQRFLKRYASGPHAEAVRRAISE